MTDANKVTISCFGGCDRSVTLRKSKVHEADYYLCHSREDGVRCEQKLPPLPPGMVRQIDMYAAGSFWGYSDRIPDEETALSLARARAIRDTASKLISERQRRQDVLQTPQEVISHFVARWDELRKKSVDKRDAPYHDQFLDYYATRINQYLQIQTAAATHVLLPQEQPFPQHPLCYLLLQDEQKVYQLEIRFSESWGERIVVWEAHYTARATEETFRVSDGWRDRRIDVLNSLEYLAYDVPHIETEEEQLLLSEEEIHHLEERLQPGGDLFVDIALHLLPYQADY